MFYFENIKTIVKKYIHDGPNAKNYAKMLNIVREEGTISKKLLSRRTRYLRKHERDSILQDLVETGELVVDVIQNESGLPETVVRIIG